MGRKKRSEPRRKTANWELIRSFFEDPVNKEVCSVSGVERMAGVPNNTLHMALKDKKPFPEKHEENTIRLLERFGLQS